MPEALRGEDIVKRFGAVTALDGMSLTLRQGEILGVLGDNGAGKSTLMMTIFGAPIERMRCSSALTWISYAS